ncbi:hypothetical protein AGABI1DRAFT_85775 [Agaricus bisporus var. burnettii JB137-S8]|uniref:Uncharacterized protein n=1 Tax=Agaricus bisporus var. burnettii (strain JB137-S8 / ATCC MYA-4627 / FGSC 10392) TaxID=597362 RepID=K5X6Q9_AGABU|nr:uncharacterized protein AGABI1DRAFT_85775 [Agaricus bisporus var. burnettii JB137-S8]EKM78903.1 hypothetical protein AGABI1DRAFT_85775 [Agaricus bisporus var. burnettii JB137-S8]
MSRSKEMLVDGVGGGDMAGDPLWGRLVPPERTRQKCWNFCTMAGILYSGME